jgi:hypothetical protein
VQLGTDSVMRHRLKQAARIKIVLIGQYDIRARSLPRDWIRQLRVLGRITEFRNHASRVLDTVIDKTPTMNSIDNAANYNSKVLF